ncbi:MAG: InlB B-repeat-containing protein, partial [Blautia sp.]|nr:InlB B-repeat-containing protein [Blautia sp.]
MKTREKFKRFLALFLGVAMMINSTAVTTLAQTVGVYSNQESTSTTPDAGSEVTEPDDGTAEDSVVKRAVTFYSEHATAYVNGEAASPVGYATVSKEGAEAGEGATIVFQVVPDEGYQVTRVLVDNSMDARTTEDGSYIIEGIQTNATVVEIQTEEIQKEEEPADEDVVKKKVTFTAEHASVYVDGEAVESVGYATADKEDAEAGATIVFQVVPEDGYQVTSVLVDDSAEARTTEDGSYIIEGIHTDETTVDVMTEEAPAEEKEEGTYTLYINHILDCGLGRFTSTSEEMQIKDSDFVNGVYDISGYALQTEGLEVTQIQEVNETTLKMYGDSPIYANIKYGVAYGYVAVLNGEAPEVNSKLRSIYTGDLSDVTIRPAGQLPVTFSFIYENGTVAAQSVTIMFDEKDGGGYDVSYDLSEVIPDGYSFTVDNEKYTAVGNVISATYAEDAESDSVQITLAANEVEYTVITRVPTKGNEEVNLEDDTTYNESTKKLTGKVGDTTDVTAEAADGYTAKPILQQEIKADGSTEVIVEYARNTYTVKYDSQGGSYVSPKKGLYQDEVEVYSGEIGTPGSAEIRELTCGKEEHTHTNSCYNWWGKLTCGKEAHTHSDGCYTITPAVPEVPSTMNPEPTRQGYTFAGWYTDAECTTPAGEKVTLTEDVTVYAKWKADTVNYTIVYLKQNLSGGYDFVSSSKGSALTGTTVSGGDNVSFNDKKYYHYAGSDSDVLVKADGTTVVYVRYDQNIYNIEFDLNTDNNNIKMTIGGNEYTRKSSKYTIQARIGEDISAKWPSASNITGASKDSPFYAWNSDHTSYTYVSKRFELTSEMLKSSTNGSTTTYKAQWQSGSKVVLHYMLQNADNDEYTDSEKYGQEAYSASSSFNAKEIYGFTNVDSESKTISNVKHYYFYYNRKTYSIQYNYKSEKIDTKSNIRFEADINNSTYNFAPERPEGVDEEWIFAGWYDNAEGFGEAYVFDTMPANNLILYAKWVAPEKTLTLVYNNGQENETITVSKGDVASIPLPKKEGFTFLGWYTDEACTKGNEFDTNAPITADATIYAKWEENKYANYTVRYVISDGKGGYTDVADPKTASGYVGSTVTEKAIALTGDYSTYAVDAPSKSIKVSSAASENVIMFIYASPAELKYKVQYTYNGTVIKSTDYMEAPAVKFRVNPDQEIVTELTNQGYTLNETFKMAEMVTDNTKNIVTFTLSLTQYTITYEGLEGASVSGNPSAYTISDLPITLNNPTKDGYIFAGWEHSGQVTGGDAHDPRNVTLEKGTVGNLTFTAKWMKVTPYVGTYDGSAHGITVDGYGEDDTVEYSADGVTWSESAPAYADVKKTGTTVDSYPVYVRVKVGQGWYSETVESYVKINPASLTVTTPDANKVYDSDPLTAEGSITGFVNGETATFVTTGSQTEVGNSKNTYSLTWDKTAKESNYVISESIGTLTVTENTDEIVVTTTGGVFTYDGEAHGATVSVSTLPKGYTLETAASADTATHVAEGTVTANCDTLVIQNAAGEDVTSRLNITYVDGSITITPATLTIVTPSDSKVYDSDPLTAEGSIDGFVKDETATFATTGSQTEVGNSKNTYSITWDGTAVASDYTISESIGTLTVTENTDEIVVTTTGGTFTYDGEEHGATVSVSTLPKGYILETAVSNDKATHVAEGTVTANCDTLVIKNAKGVDVTSKLNIRYVDGSIAITPATLTVTTPDASKVYDSDPLTAAGSIVGFIKEETATFATTGSQTEVGSSKNTYSITWDKTAAESDYTVSATVGTLTVTEYAEEITVTTTGGEFTYDGEEHGATVSVSTLPKGYTLETAVSNDKATHVAEGTVTADCDTLVIRNAAGEDVTSKLNIKYVNGSITINPATLTVSTPDASKVYDGDPLTAEGSIDGFVNGETATFATTGSQTEEGSSENTYSITWDKTAAESDYTVSATVGTLTVTEYAGEITVTTTGGTFTYDGEDHGATVSVSTLPKGYTLETATSNDKATHVADGTVTANCDTLVIKNAQGVDVTSKLNIKYVNGSITINPAALTVTTQSASKLYDSDPLTAEGSIDGFVKDETATFATTGSQTEVGSSKNTYSLSWNGTAVASDYTISESIGTLTVTEYAGEITVTTTGGTFTYDGEAHGATV